MIKRYEPAWRDGFMQEETDGDYVLFEDYENALADAEYDHDQLQKKYDRLIEILGDLHREC